MFAKHGNLTWVYDYLGAMRVIREQWILLVAVVWSVVAAVEILKGGYLFGAAATIFAIASWGSYLRDRDSQSLGATESENGNE